MENSDNHKRLKKIGVLVGRILLGGIFVFAGITKIVDPDGFSEAIENYRLLPLMFINSLAIYLPYLEVIVGLILILGPRRKGAVLLLNLMMLGFTFGIIYAMIRGLDIDCGCFGTGESSKIGFPVLIRDLVLLLISILLFIEEGFIRENSLAKTSS